MTLGQDLRALRERTPYGALDLFRLARTPVGRLQLVNALSWLAWYPLHPLAWLWRRSLARRVAVVGVTGSFGKTTTCRAIAAALGLPPPPMENFRSHLALALLRRGPGAPPVVCEVGISRRGQMRPYAAMLRPDVAVVTAVGDEHAVTIGSRDDIAREKGELVAGLRRAGLAVLAGDDPRVRALAARTPARAVTFGAGADCDYGAEAARLDWPRGTRLVVRGPGFRHETSVRLVSRHQLDSVLAATAVAVELGVAPETALARLARLAPTPGRLEPVALPNGAWLLRDEYKAVLATVATAFELLAAIPARRRFVVLGDLAEAPRPLHRTYREVGVLAGGVADRLFCVGDHRRTVRIGARRGGLAAEAITATRDLAAAAALLRAELGPGDVVLVKGRTVDKLDRISLRLLGRPVGCDIPRCLARGLRCDDCAMVERGWGGRRPVT